MKQFAIYFIPYNTELYEKGSELIGYDIINESLIKTSKIEYVSVAQKLNSKSCMYGLHLTLTDVVDISEQRLKKAVNRSQIIFSLPIFKNITVKIKKIDLMPNANVLAIQYHNNLRLFLLHIFLIVFVQSLGSKSHYTNHTDSLNWLRKIKTYLFLSPYIIDDFLPHITLVQNLSDFQLGRMQKRLCSVFKTNKHLHIKQIAVVERDNENEKFKILEFLKS